MDGEMSFKRAVIILHPEFEGLDGLKAATGYAQQLSVGAAQLIEQAKQANDPALVEQLTTYLKGFRYLVRNVPGDLL